MDPHPDPIENLASELAEGMRQDLAGVRTRGAVRQAQTGVTARRGAIRTRGGIRSGVQASPEPAQPMPLVVVEVAENQPPPKQSEIQKQLGIRGTLDLYFVVHGKHWAALAPRELNPADEEHGSDHTLLLHSLKPDFVLLPAGQKCPAWCDDKATRVMTWKLSSTRGRSHV